MVAREDTNTTTFSVWFTPLHVMQEAVRLGLSRKHQERACASMGTALHPCQTPPTRTWAPRRAQNNSVERFAQSTVGVLAGG